MRRLLTWLLAGVLVACGSAEGPHLLWEKDFQSLDNPFPDLRLVQNGTTHLRPQWYRPFMMDKALNGRMVRLLDAWSDEMREVAGLGNLNLTLLRTSEPIDVKSFEGAVFRLRKSGDLYEVLERNVVVEDSTDIFVQAQLPVPENAPRFVIVRPSIPLPENEEGLLIVMRGPKTLGGNLLERGRSFIDSQSNRPFVEGAAHALNASPLDVLLALPLRAQPANSVMKSLSDWVESQPAPAVTIPAKSNIEGNPVGVWSYTTGDWATMQAWLSKWSWSNPAANVGSVVIGKFKSRDLRDGSGHWEEAYVNDPSLAPTQDLTFVLSVPKMAKPVGGFPVALCAHGLGERNTLKVGNNTSMCLEIAQLLAKSGYGAIGIDSLQHGQRGNSVDMFDLKSLVRTRENFRQTMFDFIQLARMARSLSIDGDSTADLASELGFIGNSLGSIEGAGAFPFSPGVKTAVFNAPGAELSNLLTSRDVQGKIGLLLVAETGISFESAEYYAGFPLYRAISQWVLDSTDPAVLASPVTSDRAALLQVPLGDKTLPNFTAYHLAANMGLSVSSAGVEGTQPLHTVFSFDPATFLWARPYHV